MLSPSPHHSPSPRHANILLPLALPKESQDLSSTHRPTTSASASALPALTPFFTLVESTHDPSPHHPTTHYLFSDDDPDLITDAALLIHEPPPTTKSTPGINNRYILVTLAPDARSIVSAQSMTGDWQVLSADIRAAPTLEGEGEEGGLMLKIEGTEGAGRVVDGDAESMALEGLVEAFRVRMEELKKVVEGGAER